MSNKTITILLLCDLEESLKDTRFIKDLEVYLPKPATCNLNVVKVVQSHITGITEKIANIDPDLIVHYGLGNGCFFDEASTDIVVADVNYPIICNNLGYHELFSVDSPRIQEVFELIKSKISDINIKKTFPQKLKIAKTKEDLEYIKTRCFNEPFGMDTETNFLNPFLRDPEPQLLCYSIAWLTDEEEGWCIPTNEKLITSGECEFTIEESWKVAEEIFFESPQGMFIHNAAYDLLVLWELFGGRKPKNFMGDTMIMLYLYHYASKSASLKENTYLIDLPAYKDPIKEWIEAQPKGKGKNKKKLGFEDVPLEIIGPYAAMDAIAVVRLINFMKKYLERSLWTFYYKIPHKVILTANELACEGYTISRDRYFYSKYHLEEEVKKAFSSAIGCIEEHINTNTFNINSSQQLGEVLFKKLKLPVFSKTDGGSAATSQKALDDLILFHPFIFHLAKLKKLNKLYSTYVKGYRGTLNEGSRVFKKTSQWTINAQYKQTNRTARLANSNFTGHNGIKKKGGNILVLPSQGSMIKHYFIPKKVAELENDLYAEIVSKLSDDDRQKLISAQSYDVSMAIKPSGDTQESDE